MSALCIALSMPVFALEDMSDDAMAATDGQAGLTVSLINLHQAGFSTGYQDTNGIAAYTDPLGASSAGVSGAADLDVDSIGLTTTGITTITFDAGANSSGVAAADMSFNMPSGTFSVAGTASAALGMNALMDICTATAGTLTQCAIGSSNDVPLLVMPSSGASLAVTLTGLTLNMQAGNTPQGHVGILTDTGAMSFTLGNTGSNAVGLAFADAENVQQATTVLGGVGFKNMTLTGVDFGETVGTNYTSIDACSGSGTETALCTSLGKAGLAVTFFGTAMSGINVSINGITAGNIGTGGTVSSVTYAAASAMPTYGNLNITGLSLAGASLIVSGH